MAVRNVRGGGDRCGDDGDGARPVRMSRAEFEGFAGEYIAQFELLLRGALEEARLAPRQVTHLILTGGHSRWYFVDETLEEAYANRAKLGKEITDDAQLVEAAGHPVRMVESAA